MPTFSVTLTAAQVDRLRAINPTATAADWQEWLKRQLRAEIVRQEQRRSLEAREDALRAGTASIESTLASEGW